MTIPLRFRASIGWSIQRIWSRECCQIVSRWNTTQRRISWTLLNYLRNSSHVNLNLAYTELFFRKANQWRYANTRFKNRSNSSSILTNILSTTLTSFFTALCPVSSLTATSVSVVGYLWQEGHLTLHSPVTGSSGTPRHGAKYREMKS